MATTIITLEDLAIFKSELLEEIKKLLSQRQFASQPVRWLKSHQVMRLLTISPGTLQQMRLSGALPFSKVGGVIFYDAEDVEKMLLKNKSLTKSPMEDDYTKD